MDPLLIFKALSNETRLSILGWLKDPEASLGPDCNSHYPDLKGYACVGTIKNKSGLSQSVISGYLSTLQQAGLVKSERREKWTYYARNEETIAEFARYVGKELRSGIGSGMVPDWFGTSSEPINTPFGYAYRDRMTNLGKESETVEFKESLSQLDEGEKALSAMLNKHHLGKVHFGVNDREM